MNVDIDGRINVQPNYLLVAVTGKEDDIREAISKVVSEHGQQEVVDVVLHYGWTDEYGDFQVKPISELFQFDAEGKLKTNEKSI